MSREVGGFRLKDEGTVAGFIGCAESILCVCVWVGGHPRRLRLLPATASSSSPPTFLRFSLRESVRLWTPTTTSSAQSPNNLPQQNLQLQDAAVGGWITIIYLQSHLVVISGRMTRRALHNFSNRIVPSRHSRLQLK